MHWELLHGDCLAEMAKLKDGSVDAVVTDPPYGLSSPPDIAEVLRHWLAGETYEHRGKGFMGREWDSFVPGPAVWAEAMRVLKPGGHAVVFAGTRTMDLMSMALRLAGFEIRDTLMWLYGQGFPKSHNVGKAVDKILGAERDEELVPTRAGNAERRGEGDQGATYGDSHGGFTSISEPVTEEAAAWEGWGTALKPAWEPIILCRKPMGQTTAASVLEHGTGAINIDGCRLGGEVPQVTQGKGALFDGLKETASTAPQQSHPHDAGRWPTNGALSHSEGCELVGTKEVEGAPGTRCSFWPDECEGHGHERAQSGVTKHGSPPPGWVPPGMKKVSTGTHYPATRGEGGIGNPGHAGQEGLEDQQPKTEIVEDWSCVEGCPIAMLDAQTGVSGPGYFPPVRQAGTKNVYGTWASVDAPENERFTTPGGGSRFFYCGKASRVDRDYGLPAGEENKHPTVKPLDLMRWLVRLVTPPEGTVLDPFTGSGSTGAASLLEGFDFVGCEQDPEFAELARQRIGKAAESGHQASLF
ncbi:MAG TPA: DNA methyltransferase [Acidimicrobiales bacterium]|nr:DNA methyltransferase [Acidimicrobiales bacterium]